MDALYYREWRDQHSQESFPFIGSEKYFPNEIFSDLSISVYGSPLVWLDSLSVESNIVGSLSDGLGNSYSFSHPLFNASGAHTDIVDSSGNIRGKIVFGRQATEIIGQSSINEVSPSPREILIVPSCIFSFNVRQVSGININGVTCRGVVNFIEGDGINITGEGSNIVINAVGEKTLSDECCPESDIVLKTINNRLPINGSFFIQPRIIEQPTSSESPRQLIRVLVIEDGLQISLST
jgi:hypothetical protein